MRGQKYRKDPILIPYAVSLEKFFSERAQDLGKDVDIVGRTLFFLFAGFNTFFAFFTKEKGRIKHFAADFIFWVIHYCPVFKLREGQEQSQLWVSTPASEEPSTGTQVFGLKGSLTSKQSIGKMKGLFFA